jgi:hypothetical protein
MIDRLPVCRALFGSSTCRRVRRADTRFLGAPNSTKAVRFKVLAAVENDRASAATYAANFGTTSSMNPSRTCTPTTCRPSTSSSAGPLARASRTSD